MAPPLFALLLEHGLEEAFCDLLVPESGRWVLPRKYRLFRLVSAPIRAMLLPFVWLRVGYMTMYLLTHHSVSAGYVDVLSVSELRRDYSRAKKEEREEKRWEREGPGGRA